jgi:hypothetical protein
MLGLALALQGLAAVNFAINQPATASQAAHQGVLQAGTAICHHDFAAIAKFGAYYTDFIAPAARAIDVFQRDVQTRDPRTEPGKTTLNPFSQFRA